MISPLVGDFEVLDITGLQTPAFNERSAFVTFREDDTFTGLERSRLGFRSVVDANVLLTNDQVLVSGSLYNFVAADDQITLQQPGQEVLLTRRPEVPAIADWIGTVSEVERAPAPGRSASDLTFDGTYFWYGDPDGEVANLIQYDFATQTPIASLPAVLSTRALEWDGANLWSSDGNATTIQRLNALGIVDATSPELGATVTSIAWDGVHLWIYSEAARQLFRYDPASAAVISEVDLSEVGPIEGMAVVSDELYMSTGDALHRCRRGPFEVLQTWAIDPDTLPDVTGIGFDGTFLYVYGREFGEAYVSRVDPVGG